MTKSTASSAEWTQSNLKVSVRKGNAMKLQRMMKATKQVHVFALAVVLLTSTVLIAEEPPKKEPFVPNYITVDDVTLSSPNGNPRGALKKGTKVAGSFVGRTVLNVSTDGGPSGLADSSFFSRLGSSIEIKKEAKQVAESSNQFAFNLYQQVRQQDGNLFFSPASVSTALAMAYAGAAGNTKREMASILHLPREQNTHEGFSTLLDLLNSTGDRNGYSLRTANRLWGAKGYQFEDAFLGTTRDKYRAELETLDFGQPEQARQTINAWVEQQTREMIVDLIPSGSLQPDTRLVLTNAISFVGGWSSEFSKRATKEAPFHLTAKDTINVPTMEQREEFSYTEDAEAQVLSMPYRGYELSMVVVLPKKVDGLAELERNLTNDRFTEWTKKLRGGRPVDTYLPRFKMRSQFALSGALKSMGMPSAFSDNADFSAMSTSEDLMISEVIHQAFVDVDEEGTEAAAATAVLVPEASGPPERKEPIIFRADHPFLFLIRDNRTGSVLFMGRVQRP